MAQEIIPLTQLTESQNRLRALSAMAQFGALSSGIRTGAEALAQTMFDYAQRKRESDELAKERKRTAMNLMVSKYGFDSMGPQFALEYEDTFGVKFPRDEAGSPKPPETYEERIKSIVGPTFEKQLRENPHAVMQYLKLEKPSPSPQEMELAERKMEATMAYQNARLGLERWRAATASAAQSYKENKDNAPSGYVATGDPKDPFHFVGFDPTVPSLSQAQLASATKAAQAGLKAADNEIKQRKLAAADAEAKRKGTDKFDEMVLKLIVANDTGKIKKLDSATAAIIQRGKIMLLEKLGVHYDPATDDNSGWWSALSSKLFPTTPTKTEPSKPLPTSAKRTSAMGMSDDQLRAIIAQRLSEGMSPADILEQTGGSMRAFAVLQELVPPSADVPVE